MVPEVSVITVRTSLSHSGQEAKADRGGCGPIQPSRTCPQGPTSSARTHHLEFLLPPRSALQLGTKPSTASVLEFHMAALAKALALLSKAARLQESIAQVHPSEMAENTEMLE